MPRPAPLAGIRLLAIALACAALAVVAPARAQAQRAAPRGAPALDSITAGLNFTCGLTNDGRALCWGEHQSGQLGAGTVDAACALTMRRSELPCARGPVEVAGQHRFVAIRAGGDHACAIDRDGDTWCWGVGYFSPMAGDRESRICRVPRGDGERQQVPCSREPSPMPRLARDEGMIPPRMRAVAGGAGMTCTADESGDVWCWSNYQIEPWRVLVGRPVTTVAAGGANGCALTTEGSVRCWEWDGFRVRKLATVIGDTGVIAIAVGPTQACALDASGEARCWGRGEEPAPVGGEVRFERIATGTTQSCGIAHDGALWCWTPDAEPARLHAGLRFTEVAVGAAHACAVTTAHVPMCWGANASGQLGDGSRVTSEAPVRVRTEGLSPARAMAIDLRARFAGFMAHGGAGLLVVLALAFVLRARVAEWGLAHFVALCLGALVLYTVAAVGTSVTDGAAARALDHLRPQLVVVLLALGAYVLVRAAVRGWRRA